MKGAIQSEPIIQSARSVNQRVLVDPLAFSAETLKVMRLVQEHKLFPNKYWQMQKARIVGKVHRLYKEQPTLPVKQVVISILTDLPDFLPSWNIHRVTGYVIQTWKELSQAEEAPEPSDL